MAENVAIKLDISQWDMFLLGLTNSLKSTSAYLQAAANTIGFKDIIDHFTKETDENEKWPPRAPSTQKMYAMLNKKSATYNPSNKLLQLTGRTRSSLLPGRNNAKRYGTHSVQIIAGTNYSGYLDEGTRNMPARPFMWFSSGAQEVMAQMVLDLLLREKTA